MDKIKVIATRDGQPGVPEEIGEIDGGGLSYGRREGVIRGPAGHQLINPLQANGYTFDREFHLIVGDLKLGNCSIHRISGIIEFDYLNTFRHPADE